MRSESPGLQRTADYLWGVLLGSLSAVKPVGLRGIRRYGRMAAAMIVIVLSVAGCGLDSSPPAGPTVPDGAIDVPPPAIPNADPAAVAWLDRLMADAQQGGSADTSILTQA